MQMGEDPSGLLQAKTGAVLGLLNRFDEALPLLNRAIELNPNLAVAYNIRGYLYASLGRNNEALADFTRYIELTRNNPNPVDYLNRAAIYSRLGRYAEALRDVDEMVKLGGTPPPGFYEQLRRSAAREY